MNNRVTCSSEVIWHIGYPKCASTSLQQNLFFESGKVNYISCHVPEKKRNSFQRNPRTHHFFAHFQAVEPDFKTIIDIWENHLVFQLSKDKINVVSHELILNNTKNLCAKLDLIRMLTPSARVLVVFRKPHEILRSYYDYVPYNIFEGKNRELLSFDVWLDKCKNRGDKFIWSAIRFENIFPEIIKRFPDSLLIDLPSLSSEDSCAREFIGVDEGEWEKFIHAPRQNTSMPGLKRLSRRLLRRSKPSDYLTRAQIEWIEATLAKFGLSKQTRITPETYESIVRDFSDAYSFLERDLPQVRVSA